MSVFNLNNIAEEPDKGEEKPLIMIIDDELENINVLRQLLDPNFHVITCLDGREALNILGNYSPHPHQ